MDWDKTTFRVTRIPSGFAVSDAAKWLSEILEIDDISVRVHSLAADVDEAAESSSDTATVSFRTRPIKLPPSATEWGFDIPARSGISAGDRFFVDTRFDGFTPLSSIAAETQTSQSIDCIVIHGWGGHAIGSFKAKNGVYSWIRDSLPRCFPQLRVWTYGYDAKLTNAESIADVDNYAESFYMGLRRLRRKTQANIARRPLIFIVHSLGGWLFKKAIVLMNRSSNQEDRQNLLCTYGALLFGVPNHGMNTKAIAGMVENLPGRFTLNFIDQSVGYSQRAQQNEEFCRAFPFVDSKIVQFYELRSSPTVRKDESTGKWLRDGPRELLVPAVPAASGRTWETGPEHILAIDADHSDIVKFSENDRTDYSKVLDVLEDFVQSANSVIEVRIESYQPSLSLESLRTPLDIISRELVTNERSTKAKKLMEDVKETALKPSRTDSTTTEPPAKDIKPVAKPVATKAFAFTTRIPNCSACHQQPTFPAYTCNECPGKIVFCKACLVAGRKTSSLDWQNIAGITAITHEGTHNVRAWNSGLTYAMTSFYWPAGTSDKYGTTHTIWEKISNLKINLTPIPIERTKSIQYNARSKGTHRLGLRLATGSWEIRFYFKYAMANDLSLDKLGMITRAAVRSKTWYLGTITMMVAKTKDPEGYINNKSTPPSDAWTNKASFLVRYSSDTWFKEEKLRMPNAMNFAADESLAIWVTYEVNEDAF